MHTVPLKEALQGLSRFLRSATSSLSRMPSILFTASLEAPRLSYKPFKRHVLEDLCFLRNIQIINPQSKASSSFSFQSKASFFPRSWAKFLAAPNGSPFSLVLLLQYKRLLYFDFLRFRTELSDGTPEARDLFAGSSLSPPVSPRRGAVAAIKASPFSLVLCIYFLISISTRRLLRFDLHSSGGIFQIQHPKA